MKLLKSLIVGAAVLSSTVLGGCFLNDGGSSSKNSQSANLIVSMGVKDVNKLSKQGLGKSSAITLERLVITLTSSVGTDPVIRDTVWANDSVGSTFKTKSTAQQTVLKTYSVKPLRDWVIQVKTLDVNDSVIHSDSDTALDIQAGELRQVILNLSSKFIVYVAKYFLPDSIGSIDTNVTGKQKLNIKRFVMVIDGDTVRDTSATSGYFAAAPDSHLVIWDYVSTVTDTHSVELYVYTDSLGGMGTWDPRLPLFGDTIEITDPNVLYAPELPWTGPGSPHDPNYDPLNPGGAQAGVEINIGAVGVVNIAPTVPTNTLPKRKD